jgi:hypothetical protein
MQLVTAFVVFLCGLASQAIAQEMPDYDTEAFCEQRAGGKAPNNRRYASCLTMEKLALDQIEDYWPEASETIRSECIEEAGPGESYVGLASCVMFRVRKQRRHAD